MFSHGMRLVPYYVTTFCVNLLLYALTVSALWIAGAVAKIEFFSLMLVFFLGWGLCLVSFAFLLSTLISSPRFASVVGYVIALFGSLIGVVICAGIYGDIPLIGLNQPVPWYMLLVPQFSMARAVYLMSHRCNHDHECYSTLPSPSDELGRVLLAIYGMALLWFALALATDVGLMSAAQLRVRFRTWLGRGMWRGALDPDGVRTGPRRCPTAGT